MNSRSSPASRRPSILRTILIALAVAFVIGLVIGTLLRQKLEKPTRYIGSLDNEELQAVGFSSIRRTTPPLETVSASQASRAESIPTPDPSDV